jgi:F420-dependent oxidoreductase-like protein
MIGDMGCLKMKFGVRIPNLVLRRYFPFVEKLDFAMVKDWALESERLGFHSVWVNDHLVFGSILECWTTIAALSTITSSIRLGPLVLCNNFRYPSMVAKMAATLDVISNGRLELGIGAGWHEVEHRAYGFPLPSPRVRMERLEDALQIITQMWTEDKASFKGKHYSIEEAVCDPHPVQQPHPPIMVGSSGEKVGLRLVAQYADVYNAQWCSPVEASRKLEVLKRHCMKVGRDYNEIEKSWWGRLCIAENSQDIEDIMKQSYALRGEKTPFDAWFREAKSKGIVGTPDECVEKIREYMDTGISFIIIRPEDIPSTKGLHLFTEKVIPRL